MPAATDQYLLPTGCSAANLLAAIAVVDRWDRQMDGQTLDRYIDPAPHAMQAASITQKTIMLAAITQPLTCESTNNIRYLSIGIKQYITCVVPISRSQLVNQERMRPVGVVPRSESLLKFLQCFDTAGLMTSKASRYV